MAEDRIAWPISYSPAGLDYVSLSLRRYRSAPEYVSASLEKLVYQCYWRDHRRSYGKTFVIEPPSLSATRRHGFMGQ